MKTAFLVMGPESSGNHLHCEILKRMGCFWEDEMPIEKLCGRSNLVVLRRSIPHGDTWHSPAVIRKQFAARGFEMKTVVPVRDWAATILSNFWHRRATVSDAAGANLAAYSHLASVLPKMAPYWISNSSLIFKDPRAGIRSLELFTGLVYSGDVNWIYDADRGKHQLLLRHGDIYAVTKGMIKEKLREEVEKGLR